jgi:hypothetical protein
MNEATTSSQIDSEKNGLRSISGIRWLLLAGSTVTGVSVFRLVHARWDAIPVPLQFLILVAGALAIFGLGNITRRRLRLPAAGSALLFLFTGLVPVMAWGAVYLKLLDTPGGWLAFGAGMAALLGAAVSVLRSVLRYPGTLYPAALGTLLAAQAILPWLGSRGPWSPAGFYGLATVILGAVLHLGSRHINRFFFHRDRRDGVDRPVHLVPFLLLGVLYAGALSLLDLRSAFLALPLAVLGWILTGTGEEYYQALADSLGEASARWPRRSVALLALGFSCIAVSLPLARLDPTGRCLPLVALVAACLFLRWGLRHGQTVAHVAGVLAACVAYLLSPTLWPELAQTVQRTLTALLGFSPDFETWGLLGFLALLIGLGALLVRRQAPEKLRQAHGVLMALLWLWTTAAALASVCADAALLLAIALGLMLLAGIGLLWDGLARPESERVELGLALIVAWLPAQLFLDGWPQLSRSAALIAGLAVAGVEFGALILAARRGPGRWLARRRGMEAEELGAFFTLSLRRLTGIWLILSGAACLLLAGWDALILALVMVGLLFLARIGIDGWEPRLAFPARLSLLPLLQLAVLLAGCHLRRDLPLAIFYHPFALLPWIAIFGLLWRGLLLEALDRRRTLNPWAITLAMVTGWGYLAAFLLAPVFAPWANVTLIAVAAGWAAVFTLDGLRDRTGGNGWAAQTWAGLGLLHAFTAGWLHWGSGLTPWILLGLGTAEYALGELLSRTERGAAFALSCRRIGLALPLAAGALSLLRIPAMGTVWFPTLVTFLVSLFYIIVAAREPKRVFPALASVAFLGLALLKVIALTHLGLEFYFLAPGFALLALAWLLRRELGPVWSRHLAAAGASCVYATPIVALSGEISWGWLAALLLCAVGFGAASFTLRSRSLLTVSTAALLTDLGFVVFRIGTTAPTVLWVLGLVFGLALMAVAAWLEHQREGVLQQIRLFGRELRAWS